MRIKVFLLLVDIYSAGVMQNCIAIMKATTRHESSRFDLNSSSLK